MARPGTEKFLENPLEFARTHPLLPSEDPLDFAGNEMKARVKVRSATRGVPNTERHTLISMTEALKLARIEKVTSRINRDYGGYRVQMQPFASGSPVPAGWFTCWYLPWNFHGGQVDMRIPTDMITNHDGQDVRPNVFFTAALSGCSVFVRGRRPESPEIFHGGSAAVKTWQGSSADHWRSLYKVHRSHSKNYAEVNFMDYIGPTMAEGNEVDTPLSTPRIEHYMETVIKPEVNYGNVISGDLVDLQGALGMGCVFGLRDELGIWTFYLQENVQVMFYRLNESAKDSRFVNRTMQVKQIWPKGGPPALVNENPKGLR
jgi:hypothetical protein